MAAIINPLAIERAPQSGRVSRSPTHRWNVRAQPWQIQPVVLAPVIPGETFKSGVLQARVVSDPVKNRLIGWWHEYYVFYVPFRAMAAAEELTKMVIDPSWDAVTAGITSNTANAQRYFGGRNSIDWTQQCLNAVVRDFFRDENETNTWTGNGLPLASINSQSWTDSMLADNRMVAYDVNVDGPDANTTIQASEVQIAMQQYELLKANGLIEMDYEDYLRTYGIKGNAVRKDPEFHAELLRYTRDWQYPSNTVDSAGAVSTALSWSVAERIDKDRFFKEPGFICAYTVSRPKVYLGRQVGSAAMALDNIGAWLPSILSNDPYTSMMRFADGEGPMLDGFSDGTPPGNQAYWIDVRDLFLYGDQFVNNASAYTVSLPGNDGNIDILPTAATTYDAELDKLFVEQTGTKQHIEQDGLLSMHIQGRVQDFTSSVNKATLL